MLFEKPFPKADIPRSCRLIWLFSAKKKSSSVGITSVLYYRKPPCRKISFAGKASTTVICAWPPNTVKQPANRYGLPSMS